MSAFYRIFQNRKKTVLYAVVSAPLGYDVVRWPAGGVPEIVRFYDSDNGQWAACRKAAAEYAHGRAKGES